MNVEETQKAVTHKQVFPPWLWILAVPLGSFMFFYMGWVDQAIWYWYFGIDIAQLDVPLPVILEQSATLLSLIAGVILAIFGVVFVLRLIVLSIKNLFSRDEHLELGNLFSIREVFQRNIHLVTLIFLALLHEFLVQLSIHNSGYFTIQMPTIVTTLDTFLVPIAFLLFVRLLGDFLYILPANFKQRLRLASGSGIDDEPYRILLDILALFAASIMFIGVLEAGNASVGFRANKSYQAIQRVYLESYLPIAGLEPYRQGSDSVLYVYGPLGYLGSNEERIFLIPWKAEGEAEFPQFPPLYQIERSQTNTINIIPYEVGSP